jgi:hypothetical protein
MDDLTDCTKCGGKAQLTHAAEGIFMSIKAHCSECNQSVSSVVKMPIKVELFPRVIKKTIELWNERQEERRGSETL